MRRFITVAVVACAAVGMSAAPALAHGSYETHTSKGDLVIITGFATEPAYIGQPNAMQLEMSLGGRPVTDLRAGDVAVTVEFGGQSTELDLEPQFEVGEWGTPGDYRAAFIPTQPGKYTFDVDGTIDGEKFRYSMTSGKETFSEVEDIATAQFPAVDAPSTTDLATKIDAAAARTTDAIAAANDSADSARTLAIVAGVIAVVAVVVAIVAVARSRRPMTS
jgi:hypothetical protein